MPHGRKMLYRQPLIRFLRSLLRPQPIGRKRPPIVIKILQKEMRYLPSFERIVVIINDIDVLPYCMST